jgi:hypothetical protein
VEVSGEQPEPLCDFAALVRVLSPVEFKDPIETLLKK